MGGLVVAVWPAAGKAQTIQTYFPSGVAGYDQQLGVTVLSRLRPLYETPETRIGSFVVSPNLAESLLYNSNVTGVPGSGSWGNNISASVSANSDWTRDSLGATLGFSNYRWFALPDGSYTDWNVGLAGGYTIGDSQLRAAYSHRSYHQIGVNIGTATSQTPVLDQTDTAHMDYTFNLNRFAITPDFSVSAYRFGSATVLGAPLDQSFLDRNVLAGTITGRYSMSDEGGLLVVLGGTTSNFISPTPGQPSNNSKSILLLGGLDYQAKGVWRYRLLLGVETRVFEATQYPTKTAPIAEGSVVWTPTELTTVTGTLSRQFEDPQFAGSNGYTLTQVRLVVDHEYRRNIFLQARGAVQYAQYLQSGGGSQTSIGVGAGITWLLNRRLSLSLNYDFNRQTGNSSFFNSVGQTVAAGSVFTQSVAVLTLHFAL